MRGHLVQHGWGTELGYPAIQLDPDGVRVVGQVLTSEALDEHWARLDQFEDDGYERVPTRARLRGGREVMAYVYVARQDTPN